MSAARSSLALVVLFAAACAEERRTPVFEHRPVVAQALARLEAEVAAMQPSPPEPIELDPERVPGLVHLLAASRGRERELALEEVRQIGEAAVPQLAAIAAGTEQLPDERTAACELLAQVGGPRAAAHLADLLEKAAEPWLRAQAAWRLGQVGRDELVPRLLLRLKYETDPQTCVWIASALASYRNYAGLETLWRYESTSSDEAVRASAAERRAALAAEAGFEDSGEHYRLWYEGDPARRLPQAEPSAALRLEAWRKIRALTEWQLRGVDDARHVLSNLGAWAAAPLAEALHDEEVHLRVHVAQCLERMGPRGVAAGPELVAALDDPSFAIDAAAALGAIRYAPAEPELRARLGADHSYELRVACARALGRLGSPESVPDLERVLASSEPVDLRQAAATALVALGAGDGAARALIAFAREPAADRFGAERTLERWLRTHEEPEARATLDAWLALAPPPGIIPTPAQDAERLSARLELLEAALPNWLGGA